MANLNKVLLMGRLTRNPELRYTKTGTAVADFGLAVNRYYNNAQGQREEKTCYVDITVWAKQAELCAEYLSKGSGVFLDGRLEMDTWTTEDGQKRSKLHVVADNCQFLDRAPRAAAAGAAPAAESAAESADLPAPKEDDIPF